MVANVAVRENGSQHVQISAEILERTLIGGDLGGLDSAGRVIYYQRVCESIGLNYLTRPFEYLSLNGKLVLYAKRDAADQLRRLHDVAVTIVSRERTDDLMIVTARATLPTGRTDESIGAVSIGGLKGEALANALMKAETKSKRRVTLSICGLGFLDETEIETIEGARRVNVNHDTGEILEAPRPQPKQAVRQDARLEAPKAAEPKSQRAIDRVKAEADYRAMTDKADALNIPAASWDRAWTDLDVVTRFRELRNAVRIREAEQAETPRETAELDEAEAES